MLYLYMLKFMYKSVLILFICFHIYCRIRHEIVWIHNNRSVILYRPNFHTCTQGLIKPCISHRIVDDYEMYEKQKPFSLEDLIALSGFLNNLTYKLMWNRPRSTSKYIYIYGFQNVKMPSLLNHLNVMSCILLKLE